MRTYLYRLEIGKARGVLRVDAKTAEVAGALAKLLAERRSGGQAYFVWALN